MQDKTVLAPSSSSRVPPGTRLNGTYEVETLIADGGMGEVYKGHNIQTGDMVAIKMMLPELAGDPGAMALFRREASTLHNLSHSAIVRYFVFSVDPDLQRAYLAMEYVDGPSLSTRLKQGPLDMATVRLLQRRLADGLEAAHSVGVVHRDISPDNIILPNGDVRLAKIIDFGIARFHRANEATIIGGGFAGKFSYVSPEQLGLAGAEVTAKSDIYSLGLVLAESLRGRPLPMNGTQVEIIEKRRVVPDLSDIDRAIRPLLEAMLQPSPADRPASMAEVAEWGQPAAGTLARRPQVTPPARMREPRPPLRRGPFIAASLLALVAAMGGAAYSFRDRLTWTTSEEGSEPATQAAPALPPLGTAPAVPSVAEQPPAATVPKLPPVATGQPAKPPSLAPPAVQQPPEPQTEGAAIKEPAPPPATNAHVPTADEILARLSAASQQAPPPAGGTVAAPEVPTPALKPATVPPAPAGAKPAVEVTAAKAGPIAPVGALRLDDAAVDHDYVATLPPFADPDNLKSLTLRVEPRLPQGLVFADRGSGFGTISGTPSTPGRFVFDVVAIDPSGASARMSTSLTVTAAVEPAVPAQPKPQAGTVLANPQQRLGQLVRGFDGGPCFYIRSFAATSATASIEGFGTDPAPFQRLETSVQRDYGFDPQINMRKVTSSQCAALDLLNAAGAIRPDTPLVSVTSFDVGKGRPLTGEVSGVGDRHLSLLLVTDDGQVVSLDRAVQAAGGLARFTVPMTADARSVGAPQLLLALASSKPLGSLEGFRAASAAEILPRVTRDLEADGGTVDVKLFKLVD